MPLIARDWTQQTSASRAILALLLGATIGASLYAGWNLFVLYDVNGPEHFVEFAGPKGSWIFLVSFFVLLVGLVFFGSPVWVVLHETGRRRCQHAALAGALVPFVVYFAFATGFFTGHANVQWTYYDEGGQQWLDGVITGFGWMIALKQASQFAVIGAFIGLVIWRVAYRRDAQHA
jgi:MFS family permease